VSCRKILNNIKDTKTFLDMATTGIDNGVMISRVEKSTSLLDMGKLITREKRSDGTAKTAIHAGKRAKGRKDHVSDLSADGLQRAALGLAHRNECPIALVFGQGGVG